ncbi:MULTISPECIES: sugar ABC transporter ATP-binding protein [Pacificibacter]|uniref:sugar ABC transporter ATP-binding protein n=1 Tax=Pacificibacter TaxID=1042323 RepID=UPI001C086889|nr:MULTISPECIES: sugar ABC transporter ATP-binding protein [Pacificibacter]MBU2937174.1 sugar ABC transporter ATP-binding protein [Pacificibacter marinus]MDO6617006.1 sugar ABC transporter ATP-binding protein [Pacificibacter sp. 1_MG-2023]
MTVQTTFGAQPVLKMIGIGKRFPGVSALRNIDFEVRPNEILGLLGENGAGKSVMTKIMIGIHQPDDGEIQLNGQATKLLGPVDAIKKGIGGVFQEGSLLPNLSVMENLFLCHERDFMQRGVISRRAMVQEARRLMATMKLDIDVTEPVSQFAPAAKQMIEIARVLWLAEQYGAQNPIVILDEPTTVLNDGERDTLFEILQELKQRMSIIFISHRLQEVLENCDRLHVLKDGDNVTQIPAAGMQVADIERLLVGSEFSGDRFRETDQHTPDGDVVFKVEDLGLRGAFEPLSFELRAGEIVSLVGLIGSGKEELCACIAGTKSHDTGTVWVDGVTPAKGSPQAAVRAGIGHVPVERREEGLALNMSVMDNMNHLVLDRLKTAGAIHRRKEIEHAHEWVAECLVKTPTIHAACSGLSGGNQQKIILSKWLSSNVKVLILDHPTRGIDIGAKDEVYRLIRKFSKAGIAMIIMCDTLEEDTGLANKMVVMSERKVVDVLDAAPEHKPTPTDLIKLIV